MSKCNKYNSDGSYNPFNECSLSILGGQRLLQLLARHGETHIRELKRLGNFTDHQLELAILNNANEIIRNGDLIELRLNQPN